MRISNPNAYLAGADSIIATQLVQGSAKHLPINLTLDGVVIDLTNATFEFDTQPGTGTITPDPKRSNTFSISDLTLDSTSSATARDTLVTTTTANRALGTIDLYLPAPTIFTGTVAFDTNVDTPVVVGTLRWSDGVASVPTIRSIRILIFIRYGVIAA